MTLEPDRTAAAAPAEERRRQQRDEARRAILDATESMLAEEGYERFSMRKLAARCGYTAPTIYHYFGDKPGLIDTLLELRGAELVAELEGVPRAEDALENMRAVCASFTDFGLRNPAHYRLMMTPRPDAEPLESSERARALLEGPVMRLEGEGRLPFADTATAMQVLWSLLHGLIALQHARPDIDWKPDIVNDAVDALMGSSASLKGSQ